jgi:hypothetical protein
MLEQFITGGIPALGGCPTIINAIKIADSKSPVPMFEFLEVL